MLQEIWCCVFWVKSIMHTLFIIFFGRLMLSESLLIAWKSHIWTKERSGCKLIWIKRLGELEERIHRVPKDIYNLDYVTIKRKSLIIYLPNRTVVLGLPEWRWLEILPDKSLSNQIQSSLFILLSLKTNLQLFCRKIWRKIRAFFLQGLYQIPRKTWFSCDFSRTDKVIPIAAPSLSHLLRPKRGLACGLGDQSNFISNTVIPYLNGNIVNIELR
mgnify:CR=1 FL=1